MLSLKRERVTARLRWSDDGIPSYTVGHQSAASLCVGWAITHIGKKLDGHHVYVEQ